MTEEKDGLKKLKLIYRGNKLEKIELEGVPLGGLAVLTLEGGSEVPSLEELRKVYNLEYEFIK